MLKSEIKRKCLICGAVFVAKMLQSKYCCRHCADVAYRRKRAEHRQAERWQQKAGRVPDSRDYVSVAEAVALYAISRDTLYRLIRRGAIPYFNIGERLTRISRQQLESIVPRRQPAPDALRTLPRLYSMEPEDCYTIGEICQRHNVASYSVWSHIRKYAIPTRQIGRYVYVPKREIDNLYRSL